MMNFHAGLFLNLIVLAQLKYFGTLLASPGLRWFDLESSELGKIVFFS